MAILGELDGVIQQADQCLAQTAGISIQCAGVCDLHVQRIAVFLHRLAQIHNGFHHHRGDIKALFIERQCAGIQLGIFQDAFDHFQQLVAGALDLVQALRQGGILLFLGLFLQDFAVAQDDRQRGAQFVAHSCQENTLGTAGSFGSLHGLAQRALGFDTFGDIVGNHQPPQAHPVYIQDG